MDAESHSRAQRKALPPSEQHLHIPAMSQAARLERLMKEFERVGVDPNTISAGLAVREDDALRVLASLPDNAGPEAFLQQLRTIVSTEKSQ